jgi:hypothetical protein
MYELDVTGWARDLSFLRKALGPVCVVSSDGHAGFVGGVHHVKAFKANNYNHRGYVNIYQTSLAISYM